MQRDYFIKKKQDENIHKKQSPKIQRTDNISCRESELTKLNINLQI